MIDRRAENMKDKKSKNKERLVDVIYETSLAEFYRWTCDECGDVFETEFDIRGNIVTCENCGAKNRII